MNYWVNIHHPPGKGQSQQCAIYVQCKNKHLVRKFKKGDLAFIYETKTSPGVVEVTNGGKSERLELQKGSGGIIALVEVTSDFNSHKWTWGNIPFIGDFETQIVIKKVVSLKAINHIRSGKGLKAFNPRINGGLRKLTPEEFSIMARLIGFRKS